jgi:hypothetical protein
LVAAVPLALLTVYIPLFRNVYLCVFTTLLQDRHVGNILVQRVRAAAAQGLESAAVTATINTTTSTTASTISTSPASPLTHSSTTYAADDCLYPIRNGALGPTPPSLYGYTKLHSSGASAGALMMLSRKSSLSTGNSSNSGSGSTGIGSSGGSDEVTKLKLIPIDHGFCLPHALAMSDTDFAWLHW